jgi:hypothetical protein
LLRGAKARFDAFDGEESRRLRLGFLLLCLLLATGEAARAADSAPANAPSPAPAEEDGAAPPLDVEPSTPPLPPSGDATAPVRPIPSPGSSPAQTLPAPRAAATPAPTVASPAPAEASKRVDIRADYGIFSEATNTYQGQGHVVLVYQDITLQSDRMEANMDTRDVVMTGNVLIRTKDRTVRGDMLTFNLRTRAWKIGGGEAAFLPPRMLSPLFVHGADVTGTSTLIEGGPGSITTCDRPEPHYHIEGKRISILPDKRAVIEGAAFYVGGKRLFKMRRLVIPLRRNKYNLAPEVGQNNIEGAYVKTAYHYPTRGGETGTARLDLMSKKGIGAGLDQGYRLGKGGTGEIVLYSILAGVATGGRELTGSLHHNQNLGPVRASFQTDFRRNSYQFQPGSTTVTYNLGLNRGGANDSTAFNFNDNENSGSFGSFGQRSYSLTQTNRWGATSSQAQIRLFDSDSGQFQSQELDSQVKLDRRLPAYDIGLNYDRRDPLKTTEGSLFSGLDRLPEVTFATDRNRGEKTIFRWLPGSLGLSVGEFHEDPNDVSSLRALIDLGLGSHVLKMGDSRLTLDGDFKQMVYSGDSAQYVPNLNANWTIPLSRVRRTAPPPRSGLGRATGGERSHAAQSAPPAQTPAVPNEGTAPPVGTGPLVITPNGGYSPSQPYAGSFFPDTPLSLNSGGYGGNRSAQGQAHNELAFRYLYLDHKGYTPFLFDTVGSFNQITADYVHREKRVQATLGTGRDLRGGTFAWNDLQGSLRYSPSVRFQFGLSTAYDLNQGQWRDVVDEIRYRFGRGFVNLGVRYTPLTDQIGTLRWNIFTPISRKYSVQTFGSWNGYAKRYDARVLRINWEHHDFRASLSYVEENSYRIEKGFQFTLTLRAFPAPEETATGQYGQILDSTEMGSVF